MSFKSFKFSFFLFLLFILFVTALLVSPPFSLAQAIGSHKPHTGPSPSPSASRSTGLSPSPSVNTDFYEKQKQKPRQRLESHKSFKQKIYMMPGQAYRFLIKNHEVVWVGKGSLLKVREVIVPTHRQLHLTALKKGITPLHIGKKSYEVHILKKEMYASYDYLQRYIEDFHLQGLQVQVGAKGIVLGGELWRVRDWFHLAKKIPAHLSYEFAASIEKSLRDKVISHFKKFFKEKKLHPLEIQWSRPFRFILPQAYKEDLHLYQKAFSTYGVQIHLSGQSLSKEPLVKVVITIAEVRKTLSEKIGLQWPSSYSAQPLNQEGQILESPLHILLQALEQRGKIKVIAKPSLICKSGKSAKFHAGGEFPIKILNYKQHQIVWRKYGILIEMHAKVSPQNRVQLKITTEVSSMDLSQSVDGVPGLLVNRVQSHFNLKPPATIALSGLIKQEQQYSENKVPLLSSIPLFSSLFKSKDYQTKKSDVFFFVSPSLITEN